MCAEPTLSAARMCGSEFAQPVQAQGELEFERAIGALPVVPEQLGQAVDALGHRVDVDVQRLGSAYRARAHAEVDLEGLAQRRVAPLVVLEDGADRRRYEPVHRGFSIGIRIRAE